MRPELKKQTLKIPREKHSNEALLLNLKEKYFIDKQKNGHGYKCTWEWGVIS